jgi:hypothetical protein
MDIWQGERLVAQVPARRSAGPPGETAPA